MLCRESERFALALKAPALDPLATLRASGGCYNGARKEEDIFGISQMSDMNVRPLKRAGFPPFSGRVKDQRYMEE